MCKHMVGGFMFMYWISFNGTIIYLCVFDKIYKISTFISESAIHAFF